MVRGFATFLTQGDGTERYPREDHDRRERRQHGSDLVDWTGMARLTRAATLALHERDYVRWRARAVAARPTTRPPISCRMYDAVDRRRHADDRPGDPDRASAGFLGFGIGAPTPSWGNAQELATTAPALAITPGC